MSPDAVVMLGGFCLGCGTVMAISGASIHIRGLFVIGVLMIFIGLVGSFLGVTHRDFPIDFCN